VGPRVGLDGFGEEKVSLPGFKLQTVQPVPSWYTNYTGEKFFAINADFY
jgi:hypothetical protein